MMAKRLIKVSILDSVPSFSVHRNLAIIYTQQILLESEIAQFLQELGWYHTNTKEGISVINIMLI